MKKCIILTKDKDLYNVLNELHFKNEVSFEKKPFVKINTILNNINKHNKIIEKIENGKTITLKKINNINYKLYKSQ
jgi:hypothetical protein